MEISQKVAEEEERYRKEMEKYVCLVLGFKRNCIQDIVSHVCMYFRIEAEERKHNRNWEEDWGSREKSKSPSPVPSPIPLSHPPPPSKPRSSGRNIAFINYSMLTTCVTMHGCGE